MPIFKSFKDDNSLVIVDLNPLIKLEVSNYNIRNE